MNNVRPSGNFEPVAISPAHGEWFAQALAASSDPLFCQTVAKFEAEEEAKAEDGYWPEEGSWMCRYRPYNIVEGVLYVPISGGLTPNFPYHIAGYLTGYEYISRAVTRGLGDETVRGIALVVDSGGGYVQGMAECADKIYSVRGQKPIQAFCRDFAYSAAYALACCADTITAPQTGGVGSVGVIATHFDVSDMMSGAGIRVTIVRSGDKKASGHPYERLGKKAKARIQERVDHSNEIFAALVARNRGMDADEVKALEGEAFMSHEAVENGLADTVGSFDDAVAEFSASLTNSGGGTMSNAKGDTAVDKTVHDKAVTDAKAEGVTEGTLAGSTAERGRISAIMDSDEAKTRPAAAMNVAMHTDQSADEAAKFLARMPEEAPKAQLVEEDDKADDKPKGKNPFTETMDKGENPNLGAGDEGDDGGKTSTADNVSAIMGDHATLTGRQRKSS